MDKYTKAIAYLCELLDSMIYFPFKDKMIETSNFGFIKEKFKSEIEKTINELKIEKIIIELEKLIKRLIESEKK